MNAASDLLNLGRVVLSLIVVVAFVAILARVARRASVRGPGAGLAVVDRVGLSREASLAVVAVGGRALVVGVTAQGVSLLTELDADTAAGLTAPRGDVGDRDGDQPGHPGQPDSLLSEPARRRADHRRGSGSVLDPRTWRQLVELLRDLTVRR